MSGTAATPTSSPAGVVPPSPAATGTLSGRLRTTLSLGLLLLWLGAVAALASRHEPWRDEVRALTLATEPAHFWQLPGVLRNEGHPVLWYLLLRFAHALFGTPVVLKGTSIAVAFLSLVLLFWRAPFPLGWKALFAFSFLPLYEYSVLARNYGLSLLLAFAFAAAYPLRNRHPYLLVLLLACLANSNLHSLPLAGGFLALWLWEEGASRGRKEAGRRLGRLAVPAALVVLAAGFALWTSLPEPGSLPPGVTSPSLSAAVGSLAGAALHPGSAFSVLLPFPAWGRDLVVWTLLAGLGRWWPGCFLLLGYDLLLQALFRTVYPGGLRQQGLLLVAAVALYWMAGEREEAKVAGEASRKAPRLSALALPLFQGASLLLLPALFALHIYLSRGPLSRDWERPFTSAKALAAFLSGDPALRGAILLPEPGALLESLPYYSRAPIYMPRQETFSRRTSYAGVDRKELTLGDLLGSSRALSSRLGVPVLIVWGHTPLEAARAGGNALAGGGSLRWSEEEAAAFLRSFRPVADFRGAISDENYRVYRLSPADPGGSGK